MTCIAGLEADGKVWIGGDSAGVAGWSMTVCSDEKVFKNGEFLFGFTSSFRMGEILRYAFSPPEQLASEADHAYLSTRFIDSLRSALAAGGFKRTHDGVESGGTFLLGYRRSLYLVQDDLAVLRAAVGYGAVGCGHEIAKGCLYGTDTPEWAGKPGSRVYRALDAAAFLSAGVRAPFTVLSI